MVYIGEFFHLHLKRLFCRCLVDCLINIISSKLTWFFMSLIFWLIFWLLSLITEGGILKSPIILVDLYFFTFTSACFGFSVLWSFMYLYLLTNKFSNFMFHWELVLHHYKMLPTLYCPCSTVLFDINRVTPIFLCFMTFFILYF